MLKYKSRVNIIRSKKMISIIIPIYNEEEVLPESYKRIKEVAENLKDEYELVFINDGSRDKSLQMLKDLANYDKNVVVLSFSRNFGHQCAVSAGMEHCKGNCAIIIDADLQDPPKVIYDMVAKWKEGYDIVYGKRKSRAGESFFKKFTAKVYYKIVASLSEFEIPRDSGDFRLIDRKVIDTLNDMPEHNRYLRGMNAFAGYKQFALEYEREARFAGETHYTMKKMVKLASDGILSNSNKPLKLPIVVGFIMGVISKLGLLTLIILAILSATGTVGFTVPLDYWTIDIVLIAMSAVLLSNGLTNLYLGRVYDEVKNRPKYIISEKYNVDTDNDKNKK